MENITRNCWYRHEGDALVINVHVQPGARNSGPAGLHGDRLKLKLRAPARDGKANHELLQLVAKLFDVPAPRVEIVRGHNGRRKTLKITRPGNEPAALADTSLHADTAESRL